MMIWSNKVLLFIVLDEAGVNLPVNLNYGLIMVFFFLSLSG